MTAKRAPRQMPAQPCRSGALCAGSSITLSRPDHSQPITCPDPRLTPAARTYAIGSWWVFTLKARGVSAPGWPARKRAASIGFGGSGPAPGAGFQIRENPGLGGSMRMVKPRRLSRKGRLRADSGRALAVCLQWAVRLQSGRCSRLLWYVLQGSKVTGQVTDPLSLSPSPQPLCTASRARVGEREGVRGVCFLVHSSVGPARLARVLDFWNVSSTGQVWPLLSETRHPPSVEDSTLARRGKDDAQAQQGLHGPGDSTRSEVAPR